VSAPAFRPFSLPGAQVVPDPTRRPHTGTWRTGERPEVDLAKCVNCLLCWVYCPDRAILTRDGVFQGVDYDLCKGCGICVEACPTQALVMAPEPAGTGEGGGRGGDR
jgi:2-oxoacid:acceptor oxidoreductase delta subunit (pyruvate/2-ketoisovalerate family)